MPLEPPLRNDGRTLPCAVCGRPFPPAGRQVFCSGACRQMAWRRRQPTPLAWVTPRNDRRHTVYQCPECDNRYLGDQYCRDCGRFCQRVGVGGPCPSCDEPVAVSDLLPEYAEPGHHPRGKGGRAPSPPDPLTPGACGTPTSQKQEVIHRT
jgi:ribosomal protein L24E